jgi:ABC-2 type transport system permease protein
LAAWPCSEPGLVLAAVVSFQLRFLFGSAAFWTPDYRSLFMLLFPVLWLASGFVVPVDFFPGPLRALVDWSPLIPLLMAPVRVATGAAGMALATQVAWVVALWLAGRLALALASRRLVVHGG